MERAKLNPVKDKERAQQIAPYLEAFKKTGRQSTQRRGGANVSVRISVDGGGGFKVSLFAQELGTAVPVSPKRLDEKLRQI